MFSSGMHHIWRMCNLSDPSFASAFVRWTEDMWNLWKCDGFPSKHPYLGEMNDEESDERPVDKGSADKLLLNSKKINELVIFLRQFVFNLNLDIFRPVGGLLLNLFSLLWVFFILGPSLDVRHPWPLLWSSQSIFGLKFFLV